MSKKISELDLANSINDNDIFIINQNDETKQISKEVVFEGINEKVDNSIGTNEYDNTSTYNIGDYCIYNNTLYRCTTLIDMPEDFNSNHWEEKDLLTEINKRKIKTTEISRTLNNYGNVALGLNISEAIVLCAKSNSDNTFLVPFILANGDWAAYTTSSVNNATALPLIKSGTVTITIYYIDIWQ